MSDEFPQADRDKLNAYRTKVLAKRERLIEGEVQKLFGGDREQLLRVRRLAAGLQGEWIGRGDALLLGLHGLDPEADNSALRDELAALVREDLMVLDLAKCQDYIAKTPVPRRQDTAAKLLYQRGHVDTPPWGADPVQDDEE